jgi:ATPase family associated with various cellular activities (AAA)
MHALRRAPVPVHQPGQLALPSRSYGTVPVACPVPCFNNCANITSSGTYRVRFYSHVPRESVQSRRLLSEILLALGTHRQRSSVDASDKAGDMVVIAATNRVEDLDDAIIRRFDSKVYVGLPVQASREQFIRCATERFE